MSLLRYDIKTGVSKAKTKLTIAIATVGLMLGGGGLSLAIFGTAHATAPAVWELTAPKSITFNCGGSDYSHTLDTVSNNSSTGNFTGTGFYNPNHTYTWTIGGNITGNNITFQIVYTGTGAPYVLNSNDGVISSDGSISGNVDNNCQTFTMPAGSAVQTEVGQARLATGGVTLFSPGANQQLSFEAHDYGSTTFDRGNANYSNFSAGLQYNANLTCVNVVNSTTTYFAYQVPPGNFVSGLWIVWKVTDGGSPGKGHDTASFNVATDQNDATAQCENGTVAPVNIQSVTGGNLVVHKI